MKDDRKNAVKYELMKTLVQSGYEEESQFVFTKRRHNGDTVQTSLKEGAFVKYTRCRTIKDGWTECTYEYTMENVRRYHQLV